MVQITLVRHGQANSGSQDEQGYDKLSPLGFEQAGWLGDHLRATHQQFDAVFTGTLRRHIETGDGMKAQEFAEVQRDARLNEIAYFDMSREYEQRTGTPIPDDREGFTRHLPLVFGAWKRGELPDAPETYEAFEARVRAVREDIAASGTRPLVVTSGGFIGMTVRQVMGLDIQGYANTALAIMNSSTHHLVKMGNQMAMSRFNNIAHLEQVGRHHAQTYI